MRTDVHLASSHTADVTEFTVVSPLDSPTEAGGHQRVATATEGGRTSSWLRGLWPGRVVRRSSAESEDPLMAFASETAPEPHGNGATARSTASGVDGRNPGRPGITWTHMALAALALVLLAQGALIAVWVRSGEVAALPESGSIKVTSSPAGAPVAVDGLARGATPLTIQLPSGQHHVAIGQGADVRSQTVEVGRGVEASIYVEMQPRPVAATAPATGGLQISTEPPGARVSVDDSFRGIAPTAVTGLAPGAHSVSVISAAGTVTRQVIVAAGTTSSLVVAMGSGSEFASGWLSISAPISAQVLQDGALVGTTDTPRLMLRAGKLQIELVNTELGYRAERTVQITAGKTTTLTLDVPRGSLSVNALPWAEVWIDGQRAGETPIGNLRLPIGTHELVLKHPELGEEKRTIVVGAGAPVRVGVDLRN